jgi:hypothetical protein
MPKCYIISCVACDRLHEISRRDALTCSTRCRVWLKRHPERLQDFRKVCKQMDVTPISVLMAKAVIRLRPDLDERVSAGELTLEDAQNLVAGAFHDLVTKIAKAELAANKTKAMA